MHHTVQHIPNHTMSKLLYLLLLSGCAYAQAPTKSIRKDSIPEERRWPVPDLHTFMPTKQPNNAFYRDPRDGPNVVRATLDNMPIKGPDSSIMYTMPGGRIHPKGPIELPNLKLLPQITPKK